MIKLSGSPLRPRSRRSEPRPECSDILFSADLFTIEMYLQTCSSALQHFAENVITIKHISG